MDNKPKTNLIKKPRINNQITKNPVRVIDSDGKNLGIIDTKEAVKLAEERGFDLIEISPNVDPPVCKIMDYGKFLYIEKRKARGSAKKIHEIEIKGIRIGIGTSEHDLVLKAEKASEFLEKGNKVKIDLMLKGRAKYLASAFINERLERVLKFIAVDYKIADGPKKGPRGVSITIEKSRNAKNK